MGWLERLRERRAAKARESFWKGVRVWTGESVEAHLYPLEHPDRVRLVPDDKRRKVEWVRIEVGAMPSGKFIGQPRIIARHERGVVGWIEPRYAHLCEPLYSTVINEGVTAGTITISVDPYHRDTAEATLTIGSHRYEPRRPF